MLKVTVVKLMELNPMPRVRKLLLMVAHLMRKAIRRNQLDMQAIQRALILLQVAERLTQKEATLRSLMMVIT